MKKSMTFNHMMNEEIEKLGNFDVAALVDSCPSDCFHAEEFSKEGGLWRFKFECNFPSGKFLASAVDRGPSEAFAAVKSKILNQIQEWRRTRMMTEEGMMPKNFATNHNPRILLIDDDEDLALAMTLAFDKMGWSTDVAVRHEDLSKKIVRNEFDYILLDWNLDEAMTADRVFEKSIRMIQGFSELRQKFHEHKPRVITYSAADPNLIHLPESGKEYFDYVDHWQKPLPYAEVLARVQGMTKESL